MDLNVADGHGGVLPPTRYPVIHFDCPTTATTVTVAAEAFLSTHRTAGGGVAYLRCACDGLAVFATHGRDGWRPVGHAADHRAGATAPVAVGRCA